MPSKKYSVLPGQRFGKLIAIKEIYVTDQKGRISRQVICLCDCGKTTIQRVVAIYTTVSSCGCNRGKNKGEWGHGYSKTSIYKVFIRMKFRCYNKNNKDYPYYGGRGIGICQEWLDSPSSFCEWAYGNGYKKGLTIERIDNNKGYSPENCTLVTRLVQANNTRANKLIKYNNEELSTAAFCRKHKLKYRTFVSRINKLKWTPERAIKNCS